MPYYVNNDFVHWCFAVFMWPFSQSNTIYAYLFPKVLYPLNNISLCCSIYIIIAIAFERFVDMGSNFRWISSPRYCAVCNPFAYAEHAKPDNVNRRVFKYFIIVIILSVLINIPRFLETKIVTETVRSNDSGSVQDQTFISYDVTDLRQNSDYIRYADLWGQDQGFPSCIYHHHTPYHLKLFDQFHAL